MTRSGNATSSSMQAAAQRAIALAAAQAGRFEQAAEAFERALEAEPQHVPALINLGAVYQALRRFEHALQCYARALRLQPGSAEAWNNRGLILVELGRFEEALGCLDLAISLRPSYAEALNNRGAALQGLKRWDQALASHDAALRLKPDYAKAHHNRGLALLESGSLADALASLERAYRLNPALEGLLGLLLNTRMKLARWEGFADRVAELRQRLMRNEMASQPFAVLSLIDSPAVQRRAAELWAARQCPTLASALLPARPRAAGEPLRVGYFSADFHQHATSHLMAGLFEAHDRTQVHLTAFSFGPDDEDALTRRVRGAFDQFIDVRGLSDLEVAARSRDLGIDVAVDLKGYTRDSRPGIFAARAAPVQVSYLGYPGTLGAPLVDYLVADPVVVPAHLREAYCEQVVWLPGSYQVNDDKRPRAAHAPDRRALGLPESATVLACFNHTYKLNPEVFDVWMRVLKASADAVLWLLEDNREASANLWREAGRRGVDPARVFFAPRRPPAEHLARHLQADLFVDTWPYNAHTTASDALWMGVPMVTRLGDGFASRVGASLLHAVGLPELVASSVPAYERLVVELAKDRPRRQGLRERLLRARAAPLFDTGAKARQLESAYNLMAARHAAGEPVSALDLSQTH
jgi:protein O-GlcNAc transferase